MIIWHGAGIVAVLVPGVLVILAEVGLRALTPAAGPAPGLHETAALLGALGSVVLWPIGRALNSDGGRPPFDPATGQPYPPAGGHTLFWIPVEFWGAIWPVLGFFTWMGR